MKAFTFIATTLAFTAAGIAAGMFFAPKKGSKTRRDISRKSHQYSDYLSDRYDDVIDTGNDYLDHLEDKSAQLTKKAKKTARKVEAGAK